MSMDKITIKAYIEYLRRCIRTTGLTLFEAHQDAIHREVGRLYGVSEEELIWLDENL